MLMVNLAHLLLDRYRSEDPAFSVLDLKAHYRGYRYMVEIIKMLPQKPDDNLLAAIFLQVGCVSRIHATLSSVSSAKLAKVL